MHIFRRFLVAPFMIMVLVAVHVLAGLPGGFFQGQVVNAPVRLQKKLSSAGVMPLGSFEEDTASGFFWKPSSRKLLKLNIQANPLGNGSDRITMIQDQGTEHLAYSATPNQSSAHPYRADEILLYDVNKGAPFPLNDPLTGPVVNASRVQYMQKVIAQNPVMGPNGRGVYDSSHPVQSVPAFDSKLGGSTSLPPNNIWKIVNHGLFLWGIFHGLNTNGGTIYEERFGGSGNQCGIAASTDFLTHSSQASERFPCDLNGFAFFPQNFGRQFLNLPSGFGLTVAGQQVQAGDAVAPIAFRHPEIRYFTFNGLLAGTDVLKSFVGNAGMAAIEFVFGSFVKVAESANFFYGDLVFDQTVNRAPHVYSFFDTVTNQAVLRMSNNSQALQDIARVDLTTEISNNQLSPQDASKLFKLDLHNNLLAYYQQDPDYVSDPQNSLSKNFDQKIYVCDASLELTNDPAGSPLTGDAFSCGHLGVGRSIQLSTFGGPVTAMKIVTNGTAPVQGGKTHELIFATDRLVGKWTIVQDRSLNTYSVSSFEILDSLDENRRNNVYTFNQPDDPVFNTNPFLDRFEIFDLEFSEDLNDANSLFIRDFYAYDEVDRSQFAEEDDRVNRYERRRSTFGQIQLAVLPTTQQGNVSMSIDVMNGAELYFREVGAAQFIKLKDISGIGRQTHLLPSIPAGVAVEIVLQSPAGVNTLVHRDVSVTFQNQANIVLPGQSPTLELFLDDTLQTPLVNSQQFPESLTIPVPFEFFIKTDDPQNEVVTLSEKTPNSFGVLTSTPAVSTTGKYVLVPSVQGADTVVISATDASGNVAEIIFYYDVNNHQSVIQVEDRRAPGVAVGPVQIDEGQELVLDIMTADQDGDPLLLTLQTIVPTPPVNVPFLNPAFRNAVSGGPSSLATDFRWTPAVGDRGVYDFTFRIDDGFGGFMDAIVTVTVGLSSAQNSSPVIQFQDQNGNILNFPVNANVGDTISFTAFVSDSDNDPLSLTEFNNLSPGQLQRTQVAPDQIDYRFVASLPGTFTVDISADDNRGGVTQEVAAFLIGNAVSNQAPEIKAFDLSNVEITAPVQVRIGDTAQFVLKATDANNDPVVLSEVGTLLGGQFQVSQTAGQATYLFTPDVSQIGNSVSSQFQVVDDKGASSTVSVQLEVIVAGSAPVDQDPVIEFQNAAGQTVQDVEIEAGNLLALQVNGSDPDAQDMVDLTLVNNGTPLSNPALVTLPSGLANPATGKIVWSPGLSEVNATPYEITLKAVSGAKEFETVVKITVLPPFTGGGVVVPGQNGNSAPVISFESEGDINITQSFTLPANQILKVNVVGTDADLADRVNLQFSNTSIVVGSDIDRPVFTMNNAPLNPRRGLISWNPNGRVSVGDTFVIQFVATDDNGGTSSADLNIEIGEAIVAPIGPVPSRSGGGGGGGGGGFSSGFPTQISGAGEGANPEKDPIIVNISYNASRALVHNDFDGLFTHIRELKWLRSDDRRAYWFRPILALVDIASSFDTSKKAGDMALYKEFMKPIGYLVGFGDSLKECLSDGFCRSRRKTQQSPLSRAEMGALILRLNDVDEDSLSQITPPPFPDIPLDVWFNPIVGEAKRLELMTGHEDGFFRAVDSINYAEIAQVIWNVWTNKLPVYEVKFKNIRDITKVEKTSEQGLPDGRSRACYEKSLDAGLVWRTTKENPGALGLTVSGEVMELGEEYCVTYE
ncbi:MAG: hypothetical protein P1V18_03800 [Candidatus Gracilibacteria bacterium]|nr:hypothetical protein [Candidatus Gracilibacteria bacterium]